MSFLDSLAGPLVELDRVTCGYGEQAVLWDVSLRVWPGQFVGLVGPSGAGKTTLMRCILGRVALSSGSLSVFGQRLRAGERPRVGYVPQVQTVDWNFPVTVEEVVFMGRTADSRWWPWASRTDRLMVGAVLERLGIVEYARRHIRELSGGQQQRVFLARALVRSPHLLLLDEPTTGVDVQTRKEILRLLTELNEDGTTIILSTHELNSVAAHLPHLVCLNGEVVAVGAPHEVFTSAILSRVYEAPVLVVRQGELLLVAEDPGLAAHREALAAAR